MKVLIVIAGFTNALAFRPSALTAVAPHVLLEEDFAGQEAQWLHADELREIIAVAMLLCTSHKVKLSHETCERKAFETYHRLIFQK